MSFSSLLKRAALFWDSFCNKGGYSQILLGLRNTMIISVLGLIIGIVIGTLIAATEVNPSKNKIVKILRCINKVYVGFFRGTPIVVQLLLGYYVILPILGINFPALNVATAIIGMNSGAYVSEIMRSGIMSVDIGQMEAGRAIGLKYGATMWKIIIPQAVKNILPTIGNEFISLIKETSVVSFVTVADLYKAFREIGASNYEYIVPYIVMALIYIVIVVIITFILKFIERKLRSSDKR